MVLRAYVANILASRTLLEPLTNKELAALLNGVPSIDSVKRARCWPGPPPHPARHSSRTPPQSVPMRSGEPPPIHALWMLCPACAH